MPPRYSPNDEPEKLDSAPSPAPVTPTVPPEAQPEPPAPSESTDQSSGD